MATAPQGAFVYNSSLTFPNQRNNVTAGTNTVIAGSFVKLVSGSSLSGIPVVQANATSDTATWGFTLAPGMSATAEAYTAPQGTNLNVIHPSNTRFVINSAGSFTPIVGLGAVLTSSAGVPFLSATVALGSGFFTVEQLYPDDAAADTYARYICSVPTANIQ